MANQIAILLVVVGFVGTVFSYPTSVPNTAGVCKNMTPGHGASPQSGDAPYKVTVNQDEIRSGSKLRVTLNGIDGKKFKGYYVQARDGDGNPIGQFESNDIAKTHNCGSVRSNGAHHVKNNGKSTVEIAWIAPSDYTGTVVFTATFVEDFDSFWTFVLSEPVSVVSVEENISASPYFRRRRKEVKNTRILNYGPVPSTDYSLKVEEVYAPDFLHPHTSADADPYQFGYNSNTKLSGSSNSIKHIHHHLQNQNHNSFNGQGNHLKSPYINTNINNPYYFNPPLTTPQPSTFHNNNNLDSHEEFRGDTPTYYNPHAYKNPRPLKQNVYKGSKPIRPIYSTQIDPGSQNREVLESFFTREKPLLGFRPNEFPHKDDIHHFKSSNRLFSSEYQYPLKPSQNYNSNDNYNYLSSPHSAVSRITHSYRKPVPVDLYQSHLQLNHNSGNHPNAGILISPEHSRDINQFEGFQIPNFGYLIYNPKRGPPFYIIPATSESFQRVTQFNKSILPQYDDNDYFYGRKRKL